ncbi:MAG: ATP-binding protein [Phycisphaerae bacterium]
MQPPKIGNVIAVESGRVAVLITTSDRHQVFEDRTYRVGQLGSYIIIPLDDRDLVGFVVSTRLQADSPGTEEPGLVLQVQLLGELRDGRFDRGVNEYPVVGDDVCLALRETFDTIFSSFEGAQQDDNEQASSFRLGRFTYNTDFDVRVKGSAFLAKHVGVLGNSGAGKSCTTAKILQEILDLSESQVVLFDMHGEYRAAFSDPNGQLNGNVIYLGADDLILPYWLLKYEELEELLVDRSSPQYIGTQISFLRTALLEYKHDAAAELGLTKALTLDTPIFFSLDKFKVYAENLNEARYVVNDDHLAFSQLALRSLDPEEQQLLMRTQRCQFNRGNPQGETPHPLYHGKLLGLVDRLDTLYSDRRFEFMLRPIEHGMASPYFRDELSEESTAGRTSGLMNHLIKLLTGRVRPRSNLTIIDLSGIPFEIVDITVAVLTRLLFEVNFWTPARQRHPLLMVFEEAHNYIPRADGPNQFAKKAVERVAKEGRKYGVSAMVVSQRPSELSETVLAQCNNFVVMRISNPDDQAYVKKVIGDQFAGVVDMLPVLRPGEAFVIGDSVLMPMRTLVELPDPTPLSGDADFFKIWSEPMPNSDIDTIIDYWRHQDRQRLTRENLKSAQPDSGGLDADSAAESDAKDDPREAAHQHSGHESSGRFSANNHSASSDPTGNGPNSNKLTKRLLQRAGRNAAPPAT